MRLLFQAVIALLITGISCDVFSCGGFVRSSVPSILQKVKVQFLSDEGHLKYETACNPTNGYYMIPVYTRGIYRIRVAGPDGFIFDPSEKVVNINGEDNDCSSGKDINFQLSAFQVTGKILSGKGSGPSKLELGLYTEQGKQVATTTTDSKGVYSFEAAPGKYVVSTLERTNQCVERGSVPVEVVDKPVVVATDLKISGQNLNVAVVSESSEPIRDVEVSLFSDVSIPFEKQVNAQMPVSAKSGNGYVYSLKTSNKGVVTFSCLPPGAFRVKASLKTEKGSLVFAPEEKLVTINSKLEEVSFESAGFTLNGKVIHGPKPLANVLVSLKKSNEKYKLIGTTDKDGNFVAKGLTKGSYRVKAEKERLRFDEKTFEVNSDGGEIKPIELLEVEICGQLIFDDPQKLGRSRFSIGIYDSENKRVSSVEVGSSDGKYCIYLAPGKYNVKPEFSSPVVHPKSFSVDLHSDAIDNLVFTEFKAKVEGSVSCLDACPNVKIDLEVNGEAIQTSKVTDNKFLFEDISPGSYKLVVHDNVGRCWEKEEYSLQVESKDVEGIVIKQTGYKVVIDSAKQAKLAWNGGGSHGIVDLQTGKTRFCVPKKGVYNLSVESCYDFEEGKRFSKELPKDEIVLRVKTARVGLNVKSSLKLNVKDVAVTVKSVSGEKIISSQQAELNNLRFEFDLGVQDSGSNVELIPTSTTLLFKPNSYSFNFDGECDPNLVTVEAFQGKYVEGFVEPALKDVEVRAVNKKSAETLVGKTDSYGRFKIGLVFDPSEYDVALELEGYKFSKVGSNKFKAIKLSKLVVYYFDEKTQEPLGEVLVSVSGGVDYRNNVIVDKSGRKSFVGVPAGEYFISSVLREYQFVPDQTSVSIKEGETVERKIYGKRFAYSAFGKVVAAGGLPLDQVVVQALSESCGNLLEEDVTDKEGQFRVRGLKPGCEYKLVAKSRNGQRVRAIPPFINHKAKQEDLKNLEFTLMVTASQNQLLGVLQLNGLQRPKTLIVDLYEDGKKIASDNLGSTNNLFVFNDRLAEGKEYQVKISDKQLKGVNAVSSSVSFQIPQNGGLDLIKQVTLVVTPLPKKAEIETSKSNILGIFFVIFVTVVCMNLNNSKDVALDLYDRAIELVRRDSTSTVEKRKKTKNN